MSDHELGDLELTGRLLTASNATFIGHLDDATVVYKPVAGERPLWDFPDGTLAGREIASFLVSQVFGGDIVPRTWWGEGPHGPGMLQQWCEPDPDDEAVTLVPAGPRVGRSVPDGWCHVLDGVDADDQLVSLVHEDSLALRRMAVFDLITNNADRKGGHVLAMSDGHRYGVDHGLTFHVEHKVRTVLWGWIDQPLTDDEVAGVAQVRTALDGDLSTSLSDLISPDEIGALRTRCEELLANPVFPAPRGPMPAVPWPPF